MGSAIFYLCLTAVIFNGIINEVATKYVYRPIGVAEGYGQWLNNTEMFGVLNDEKDVGRYRLCGPGVIYDADCGKEYDVEEKFKLVKDSGQLIIFKPLDREKKARYTFTVSTFFKNGTQLPEDSILNVTVFDINDSPPVFVSSSLTGSVPENMAGTAFMQIATTDLDEGINARSTYRIVDNSDSPTDNTHKGPRFSVDKKGVVTVEKELDYEYSKKVTFKVEAINLGLPTGKSFTVTGVVTVEVEDTNDHKPVIEVPPPANVSELLPVNDSVAEVTASDVDTDAVNHKTYFEIIGGDRNGDFWVESLPAESGMSRGIIKIAKPLDFETEPTKYSLIIKAYNKEAPNADMETSTATVNIQVEDRNEPPICGLSKTIVVTEEIPAPENPNDSPVLGTAVAVDLDEGRSQEVSFSIDDPYEWFIIDKKNGEIRRKGKIDREAQGVDKSNPERSTYTLVFTATDSYPEKATATCGIEVLINDVNDHAPRPTINSNSGLDYNVSICIKPGPVVLDIKAVDPDSPTNGAPFTFTLLDGDYDIDDWKMIRINGTTTQLTTTVENFFGPQKIELPYTITDKGFQTGTYTLTVSVCECDENDVPQCAGAIPQAGFPVMVIIAIVVVLLLIIILIFALLAYKRRKDAMVLKEPFFDDEDDIRENIQVYQEEGGEVDQDAYDLSALQVPLMDDPNAPIRVEKPIQQPAQPRLPRGIPEDIGDYIGDAKDQADNDPSAPPFDSLLVFDYEGLGSDAGSLSSINTATTDGSMDYDHLNNWGPRFKRLADMYNDGSDSE